MIKKEDFNMKNNLSGNIYKYRKKMKISQEELGDAIGVSTQAVSKWERGISAPGLDHIIAMTEVFSVSLDAFVGVCRDTPKEAYIGIDGGGTKTEFVLFTEQGHVINRITLEGSNANVCGLEKACEILKKGIDVLMSMDYSVRGVFGGLAGYAVGDNDRKISAFLAKTYPNVPIKCDSDILNIFALGPKSDNAVAVICGTGFIAYAKKQEQLIRLCGWGYLFEGAGSGYDMGREALRAALSHRDKIGPETLITGLVEKRLGRSVFDSIDKIYGEDKSFIASFAPVIFEAYSRGDREADRILRESISRIAHVVNRICEEYESGDTVIFSGGIVNNQSDVVFTIMKEYLKHPINLIAPGFPPILGACIECVRTYGKEPEDFAERFMKEYNQMKL